MNEINFTKLEMTEVPTRSCVWKYVYIIITFSPKWDSDVVELDDFLWKIENDKQMSYFGHEPIFDNLADFMSSIPCDRDGVTIVIVKSDNKLNIDMRWDGNLISFNINESDNAYTINHVDFTDYECSKMFDSTSIYRKKLGFDDLVKYINL